MYIVNKRRVCRCANNKRKGAEPPIPIPMVMWLARHPQTHANNIKIPSWLQCQQDGEKKSAADKMCPLPDMRQSDKSARQQEARFEDS